MDLAYRSAHYRLLCMILTLGLVNGLIADMKEVEAKMNSMDLRWYSRKVSIDDGVTYAGVNPECARDMNILKVAKQRPDIYAQWILAIINADARGTYPEKGALLGSPDATGSYDVCVKVKPSNNEVYEFSAGIPVNYVGIHNFSMQYCKARHFTPNYTIAISEGWCVPHTCDRTDISRIIDEEKNSSSTNPLVFPHHYTYCGSKPALRNNTGAIVTLSICGFFGLLVLIATLVDGGVTWLRDYMEQEDEKDKEETTKKQVEIIGRVNEAFEHDDRQKPSADMSALGEAEKVALNQLDQVNAAADILTFSAPSRAEKVAKVQNNIFYRLLVAFSVLKTVRIVVETGGSRSKFGCMNGIRVFSMMWIVLGHTWSIAIGNQYVPVASNLRSLVELRNRFSAQIINGVDLPVDSFFVIGATLVTAAFLKTLVRLDTQHAGVLQWVNELVLHIFHRWWRLTPLLAAVMMIWANLWRYLGYGPNFPETGVNKCPKYWWVNVLYIQNLYHDNGNMLNCMGYTWYLACDFQYVVIAPVFITALYKTPMIGYILLFLGWAGTTVARIVLYNQVANGQLVSGFNDIYIRPWTRFGPYAQGILLGYIIYKTECKVRVPKAVAFAGWFLALAAGLIVLLAGWKQSEWPIGCFVAWNGLKRDVFAFAVAWVVFACVHGYGGLINSFLGWGFWTPLSRLTYCCYLIHPLVHQIVLFSRQQLFYIQDITMTYQFLGNLTLSIVCSFLLTLVFEVPFGELENVLLPKKKPKKG